MVYLCDQEGHAHAATECQDDIKQTFQSKATAAPCPEFHVLAVLDGIRLAFHQGGNASSVCGRADAPSCRLQEIIHTSRDEHNGTWHSAATQKQHRSARHAANKKSVACLLAGQQQQE
jgi:hypothetical protein